MGTRIFQFPTTKIDRDHPHAYGDKNVPISSISTIVGSSPRVWGQGRYHKILRVIPGIIPTRMGTSTPLKIKRHMPKDHPHAYGDKDVDFESMCDDIGSSPRVWGQDCL